MSRIDGAGAPLTDLPLFAPKVPGPAPIPSGVPEDVAGLFETLALQVIEQGFGRYSADAILHRIRWHKQIDKGDRDFKANNNWTAPLARWFMARHPEHKAFFETRERKHDSDS